MMEAGKKTIRYTFEHQMLRDYYMKNPRAFVEMLLEDPEALFRMYDGACSKYGQANPYQPEQYSATLMTAPDGTTALKLTMPIFALTPSALTISCPKTPSTSLLVTPLPRVGD